jgi:regulator of RNase E activity RraA
VIALTGGEGKGGRRAGPVTNTGNARWVRGWETRQFGKKEATPMPTDDTTLFQTVRQTLFTAVIGDVMDAAGLTRQFLPPEIRALRPEMMLVGRAMPVLEADCCGEEIGHLGQPGPFGLMFRALDELQAGEVYVATGGSPRYAFWGGLMSTRALALGAAGAVLDGYHRDTREILGLGLPVFSMGSYAQDQRVRGRVVDYRCAVAFDNGAHVHPGDLIVGDIDGVLAVPRAHVAEIIAAAVKKVAGEAAVRGMIEAGERTEAIYAKTGIM